MKVGLTLQALQALIDPWTTDPHYGTVAQEVLSAIEPRSQKYQRLDWMEISHIIPRTPEAHRFVGDLYSSWLYASTLNGEKTVALDEVNTIDSRYLPVLFDLITDVMISGESKGYSQGLTHSTGIDGPIYDIQKRLLEYRVQYNTGLTAEAELTLSKIAATAYIMLRDHIWSAEQYGAAARLSNFEIPDWVAYEDEGDYGYVPDSPRSKHLHAIDAETGSPDDG